MAMFTTPYFRRHAAGALATTALMLIGSAGVVAAQDAKPAGGVRTRT